MIPRKGITRRHNLKKDRRSNGQRKKTKDGWCMVVNATFNKISAISWRSHNQWSTQ